MIADKIVALMNSIGASKAKTGSKDNVQTNCPFAPWFHKSGGDRNPSFSIGIRPYEPSPYRCFTCHQTGSSLIYLLNELRRLGKKIDDSLLSEVAGLENVPYEVKLTKFPNSYSPKMFRAASTLDSACYSEAEIEKSAGKVAKYILNRGLDINTCKTWEIGYDSEEEQVVFPVRRLDGKLVGAMGRTILANIEPKYKTYLVFDKSRFLYGENNLKKEGYPTLLEGMGFEYPAQNGVIVVEGMMDVLKIFELGYENVCGVMTSSLSDYQIKTLTDNGRPIYLMLDWDMAGTLGRYRIANTDLPLNKVIYNVPSVTKCKRCGSRFPWIKFIDKKAHQVCFMCGRSWDIDPTKKDPDQLTKEELLSCLKESMILFKPK